MMKSSNILHSLTLIFIGVLAYIFADIVHEAIGHGLTSLILGNRITLLSSVYFRSQPHSFITDAFGPLLNLFVGILLLIVLKKISFSEFYVKPLFIIAYLFQMFWFSWMCIYAAVTDSGDLAFYFPQEKSAYVWRAVLVLIGFSAYWFSFQSTSKIIQSSAKLKNRTFYIIPYWSAGVAALFAVSFYRPFSVENLYEALVFPVFSPMLFLGRKSELADWKRKEELYIGNITIIISGVVIFTVFCLTMGVGLKL
ncbi:hypothetical protein [Chryseobacterium sp.]|uniref:hypothetical protein n=1 Tax=Chryseobacterium sp. TaxID=1871047 RepID=UPI0011CABDA2|nr:hypothetical protein [Chryseobacterium sp.]TXF75016.1 hypothetical protein FUA25_12105 [Chryseobacterium sp.]